MACYRITNKRVTFSETEIEAARLLLQLSQEAYTCSTNVNGDMFKGQGFDSSEVSSSSTSTKRKIEVVGDDGEEEPLQRRKMKFRSIGHIYETAIRA